MFFFFGWRPRCASFPRSTPSSTQLRAQALQSILLHKAATILGLVLLHCHCSSFLPDLVCGTWEYCAAQVSYINFRSTSWQAHTHSATCRYWTTLSGQLHSSNLRPWLLVNSSDSSGVCHICPFQNIILQQQNKQIKQETKYPRLGPLFPSAVIAPYILLELPCGT